MTRPHLLNANGLPPEVNVPNGGGERAGAFMYKNHLRRALEAKTVNADNLLK